MIEIFKSFDGKLIPWNKIEDGVWVNLENPDENEVDIVSESLNIDQDLIRAALDEEESARIEYDDGTTLLVVDIPYLEAREKTIYYSTIPMGIIISGNAIITVCLKESPIIRDFAEGKVKTFFTFKRMRFILQLLYKICIKYLQYLKQISKVAESIEKRVHKSTRNKELIQMLELEKSLVYFNTSLRANEKILEKLMRNENISNYPEDSELLEDVIIENKQAIEMAKIYSDITKNTMDAFAAVINNNMNVIMKNLTFVTIFMGIFTVVSGFFGMNVRVPLADYPLAFPIVVLVALSACGIAALIMYRKKMF